MGLTDLLKLPSFAQAINCQGPCLQVRDRQTGKIEFGFFDLGPGTPAATRYELIKRLPVGPEG